MIKSSISVATLVIGLVAYPTFALADGGTSCATAQQLFPNAVYTGDTSTSTSFIGAFGGLPSPGPDLAFKFLGETFPSGNFVVTVVGGWNAGAVITAACGGNAGNPISAGTGTSSIDVPISDNGNPLTAGVTYYFYITGNPSDNSGPSGAFSVNVPFPVTLQSFEID
jgi:hypothetical protein